MSTGKIKKPKNADLPDNLSKKPLEDIIYHVVQTCDVEVDDSKWQSANEDIKQGLANIIQNAQNANNHLVERLTELDKKLGDNEGNLSDEIKALKKEIEDLKIRKPLNLVVTVNKGKPTDLGLQHYQLPTLIKILATKLNVYLVGPAGAGKTHAAIQAAKALNVPFHFTGAVASEFKLTGFMDAQGRIVSTEFRKAYENGGLFLFDEIDASYPQAVLAFNAALANDYMDFPDKRVPRHENFYCIAAANTYGQGADRQYVGRNQLDAASLDRFVFIDWNYDENLERELAGNENWVKYVQRIRKYIEEHKIRHVVSPRASIFGAKLLASGIEREVVEQTIIWKGLDNAQKDKVLEGIGLKIEIAASINGRFEPKVKINESVAEDDIVGLIVSSQWNTEDMEVVTSASGIIKYILASKHVKVGDKLATIVQDGY